MASQEFTPKAYGYTSSRRSVIMRGGVFAAGAAGAVLAAGCENTPESDVDEHARAVKREQLKAQDKLRGRLPLQEHERILNAARVSPPLNPAERNDVIARGMVRVRIYPSTISTYKSDVIGEIDLYTELPRLAIVKGKDHKLWAALHGSDLQNKVKAVSDKVMTGKSPEVIKLNPKGVYFIFGEYVQEVQKNILTSK